MSLRLPLWLYWTLAGLGLLGAAVFTAMFDFTGLDGDVTQRLLFTTWGGPITLVLVAILVTFLKRQARS